MAMYDKGEPKMECAQSNRAMGAVAQVIPPSPIDATLGDLDRYLARLSDSVKEMYKRLTPVMAKESNVAGSAGEPAPSPQCELESALRSCASRVLEIESVILEMGYRLQL